MTALGPLCLLLAFIAAGYAAFACIAGSRLGHAGVQRSGMLAALGSFAALTVVAAILIHALLTNDSRFQYVAEYGSPLLPWYYALSALWVGQAGSLLLWAWLLAAVALTFRWRAPAGRLRETAFGILLGYLGFLAAMMVFAADPMQPNLAAKAGSGLSPVLQHVQMLFHPPVVFLGYAAWGVPFALALAALSSGQLDHEWVRLARPWALAAWSVLGIGILLGGAWAYEELGWGGYWSWDPVENGSLIPWLLGTALVHSLLAWQARGVLKKTALLLAVATFALCNFATFLTRSGIFSSLHEFSQSPIGWMFLAAMGAMALGGTSRVVFCRAALRPQRPVVSLWSREAWVLLATFALLLLSAVILLGTLSIPLSQMASGWKIAVGQAFYNHVLIPSGLLLLAATAAAPLLRWGLPPAAAQRRALLAAVAAGTLAAAVLFAAGVRHPIALAVGALAAAAVVALGAALILDAGASSGGVPGLRLLHTLAARRRQYAGFAIHMGFVCLAIGITGSSLGTQRQEVVLGEGESTQWSDCAIRYVRLVKRAAPDKFIAEAELEVVEHGGVPYTLRPAQWLYPGQADWRTQVAIHTAWGGDFYAVLSGRAGEARAHFTLIRNPLMRWLWLSGWVVGAATLVSFWPAGRRSGGHVGPPAPMGAALRARRSAGHGKKGDSPHLCEAPFGPFRQMGTVPLFPPGATDG